jgi:hypothetical protein
MRTRREQMVVVVAFWGVIMGGCASEGTMSSGGGSGSTPSAASGSGSAAGSTSGSASTSGSKGGTASAQAGSAHERVASGTPGDTLEACMARIPKDASAGQKMVAEGSCRRDEADRR